MNSLSQIEGLESAVKDISLSVMGGIFHQKNGKTRYSPKNKPLVTLDRTKLAIVMLEQLTQKYDSSRLKIHFNYQCMETDFIAKTIQIKNLETSQEFNANYDLLIGADGASSVVRKQLLATEDFE